MTNVTKSLRDDPKYQEWLAYRRDALAKRLCPDSGDELKFDNPFNDSPPNRWSCDMCDCFGYNPDVPLTDQVP